MEGQTAAFVRPPQVADLVAETFTTRELAEAFDVKPATLELAFFRYDFMLISDPVRGKAPRQFHYLDALALLVYLGFAKHFGPAGRKTLIAEVSRLLFGELLSEGEVTERRAAIERERAKARPGSANKFLFKLHQQRRVELRRDPFNMSPFTALLSFLGFVSRPARIDAKRHLDAATGGRRARGMGIQPSLQADANQLGARVAWRTRYQAANIPLVRAAVNVFVSNLIGTGMRLIPQSGSDELDARIISDWETWASGPCEFSGQLNFYCLQATCAERLFVDGEVFVHMISDGDVLTLKLLDQAQCDHSYSHWLGNDGAVVAGVEINSRRHGHRILDLQILPARRSAHSRFGAGPHARERCLPPIIKCRRPAKRAAHRCSAPVVLRTNDLDQFTDAQLMRQKLGAMLWVRDRFRPDAPPGSRQPARRISDVSWDHAKIAARRKSIEWSKAAGNRGRKQRLPTQS